MILQGRNLQQGLTGPDVAELQTELTELSYTVPAAEQTASNFGQGTLAGVQQFQTAQGLPTTGIVDAATAAALTAALRPNTYTVTGTVSSAVSAGVSGLTVMLVDKNVGGDVSLASGQTDATGAYSITTYISPASLKSHNKTQPDLQVRALSAKVPLAASQVHYNAPTEVTLNISLPASITALPSEYESLVAGVSTYYTGRMKDLQEGTDRQDITYLANKSGWDARAVALAALADQFSLITAPAPTVTPSTTAPAGTPGVPVTTPATPGSPVATVKAAVSAPPAATAPSPLLGPSPLPVPPAPPSPAPAPATVSIRPEFYYALFRAGLPADPNSLFRAPAQTVQAIWTQAIAQGFIPQSLASETQGALQSYQTLSAAQLLNAPAAVGSYTLSQMLGTRLSAGQQTTFSQLYTQFSADPAQFWSAVQNAFGATASQQLQFDGQLYYLSLNNVSLVTALHAAQGSTPLSSPADLASRGYYDATNWTPLIGDSVPPQIPGASAAEQAANYAEMLAAQVRLAYPTAVAADEVRRGVFHISDTPAVATEVQTFLTTNYSTFAIGAEPVEAFLKRTSTPSPSQAAVAQIKRLQRVYQLTGDDQTMAVLLQHNLDSAFAITRYDSAGFNRAFSDKLGASKSVDIYSRAKHVYSSVMNVAATYLSARVAPNLTGYMWGSPSPDTSTTYPIIAYPTLESLFGSLDYCACEDCQSILSPAAYLVDLLHYIDQPAPTVGYQNPQAVLFQRRPDLQYLPLTCANTNTALPYIDIVNETLEYFVANAPPPSANPTLSTLLNSLSGFQGYSTDDTVTSADLLATPQFVNDAAYSVLQTAFFPPPLPFNRPLEQLRQLLQSMNLNLPNVMAALRTNGSTSISLTGTAYTEGDILIEQLGISRDERRIFTDSGLTLGDLYGYPATTNAVKTLQAITLQDFSRRTGVAYSDIVSILETQFINPNAILIERLQQLNATFATMSTLQAQWQTNPAVVSAFKANLPAGLDARAYGGATPTDYDAVVQWVVDAGNFNRISSIIVLTNPGNLDQCSGTSFDFTHLDGSSLTATEFLKLIRFIRLWQKLGFTIEQTDDILSALYPATDLPVGANNSANDTANRALLDSGFSVVLLRIGVLFQVMNTLSLTANQSLGELLACWAPIGTVGPNALYQRMFGGSTLQREDPGAPIATVGGAPNAGDVLTTIINTVTVSQTVSSGDTPATIAAKIAAQINATSTVDPTTILPLNSRIFASAQNNSNVVIIRAGCTLACGVSSGSTETFTAGPASPLSQSAAVAGAVTPGNVLTATVNTIPISYTVQAGDTIASVAVNLANAVNNTSAPDPYSGLPLNSLVVAFSSAGVVTINSVNSGAPLALVCSYNGSASTGSYTTGAFTPAFQTATVGGTITTGNQLTTTINGIAIVYTVGATDTSLGALAANIAATINAATHPDPASGMALNSILHASAAGDVITITANDPATPLSITCGATGSESYTQAGPVPTSWTATITGNFAPGVLLTTTVNAVPVPYAAVSGDTAASIATNIAAAINATSAIDPITNVALKQLVSATASANVITITALTSAGTFSLTVTFATGTYTAGIQPPPFADDGYGDFLADPTQTIYGHEPALRAAFHLTGAEFTLIANSLQFTPNTALTLANISSIFRIGWLAHTLGMSVVEFLLFRQMTGIDPFAPLDPLPSPPVDPPVVCFIELVQAMSAAGLTPAQALYLLWDQDISGKSSPALADITGLAIALRAAFAAVAAQFVLETDPDGTIAQGLMSLVYGTSATDFFFGLLNGTLVSTVDYPSPSYPGTQPAPSPAVINASGGALSYDDLRKLLSFAGVLDAKTLAAMQTAATDAGLKAALLALATANQQLVGPFFTAYPELLPLYSAFVTSTASPQQKRTTLLANFLPQLIEKRNQEQALATVTAAAGTDPSFAAALLDDATILHAATDATAPLVNDLTALNNPGLAAQIFLSNALSGTPDLLLDAEAANYAPSNLAPQQVANISGKITTADVLTTTINGVAIPYAVAAADQTAANVAAKIAAAINATTTADPFSGMPLNQVVTAVAEADAITVQSAYPAAGVTLGCTASVASSVTYAVGVQVPASQTATIAGTITAGDILTTTINTVAVSYTVQVGDTSIAVLAAHVATGINATASIDPVSGQPLNQALSAASAAGSITITAANFGPNFALICSVSAGATETYAAGSQKSASQQVTLSGLLPANDVVITTINSVAVAYTVTAADTTLAGLAANIAALINATTTVDTITGKALNTLVSASSSAGVVIVSSAGPGQAFTLSSSISFGAYTQDGQVPVWQSAVVAGGITAGDILTTAINGVVVNYTVAAGDKTVSILAGNIAAAVNATAALATVVTASHLGGVIAFKSVGSGSAFTLTCSTSPGASESYTNGPQSPALQATISGGFSPADTLTTNVNGAVVTYAIAPTDSSPTIIAANIVNAINTSTVPDPTTGLPVQKLVLASSAAGVITVRSASPALAMSCSLSVGATEHYYVEGELPAGPGGSPVAGIWSGYLNAPQDGFYNIQVAADPGAQVTLSVDGEAVLLAASSNSSIWANQGPISFTAGQLVEFKLTATSLLNSLSLSWQTLGLGWQTIPANYLYSDTQIDRLQTAYVRFLKATSLATDLSLLADEIAFLGSSTSYQVNTTDNEKVAPGASVTLTPASMTNIQIGSLLVLDSGPTQEVVSVTAVGPTWFKATIANPHDGTTDPFPIVDYPTASTGQGWLNLLPVASIAGSATAPLQTPAGFTAGSYLPASQTATVAGTIKAGDVLITTINGMQVPYTVTGADTSVAVLAGHIVAAINQASVPDAAGSPLNQVVSASNASGVIIITSLGPAFTLSCSLSAGATETYTAGPEVPASQTATISGQLPVNSVVVTTINGVTVRYQVLAGDSTPAILASHIVAAINATTTVDSVTQQPLNALIQASNTGGVITIRALGTNLTFTLWCSVASFASVLKSLLDFARIKVAISPNDDELLQVLENPSLFSSDGVTPQIVKLSGWSPSSLSALLQHFFGSTQLSSLSSIENLALVFDAFALVTASRLSAAALLAGTTNAPSPATVAALQSALRSLYADSDWLGVIKPVSDAMRIKRRDGLVAYILQRLGDAYMQSLTTLTTTADTPPGSTPASSQLTFASTAGIVPGMAVQAFNVPPNTIVQSVTPSTVTLNASVSADVPSGSNVVFVPATAVNISTPDSLYELLLMDVETQPPVETSRIRLALSSVQLFIERILRNLEPQIMSTDIDGSLWVWMQRYRVWQANREVFLWPENWLYPELRDDQSPFFTQMMSSLLQSDITDDAAAAAYLDYLSSLEAVAKLEPCGLYYVPAAGDADEAAYVLARTAGGHRKHYFRQLQYGSWTPWEEVKIDCEDMPVTPIVWNDRLMLFWLKISKTSIPQPVPSTTLASGQSSSSKITGMSLDDFQSFGQAGVGVQKTKNVTVSAVLCWSEYYNGKWQPQKSSDVNRPASIGIYDTDGDSSFDVIRNLMEIVPARVANTCSPILDSTGAQIAAKGTVQSTLPDDALVLAISAPSSPGGGFVLFNTHSLPVRWDDIKLQVATTTIGTFDVPLANLVLPPNPSRTLPAPLYTGAETSGSFTISYWTLAGDPNTTPWHKTAGPTNNILGLKRVPRTVDTAPTSEGWDSPFFFEDRRNLFYVTTAETWIPFFDNPLYGLMNDSSTASASIYFPPLVVKAPPAIPTTAPLGSGIVAGGGDPAAILRYVSQSGNIRVALGTVPPVVYQGTTLYPTGQLGQQAAPSPITGSTIKPST
jgi:peptidoglycan hydrolase-like protein with peptidoglycan-binding domain